MIADTRPVPCYLHPTAPFPRLTTSSSRDSPQEEEVGRQGREEKAAKAAETKKVSIHQLNGLTRRWIKLSASGWHRKEGRASTEANRSVARRWDDMRQRNNTVMHHNQHFGLVSDDAAEIIPSFGAEVYL